MESIGSSRAIEITTMALNGLNQRQNAISSNTANVMTPGYQRNVVVFEDQLRDMIQKEDYKRDIKRANSAALSYNATSLDEINRPTEHQLSVVNQNVFNTFKPEIIADTAKFDIETNNNVDIEKEMMDMAKTGIQYSVLANLQAKMFTGLGEVIQGGGNY